MNTKNNLEQNSDSSSVAILAETLFLANLLLIPVIPFLILFYLYKKYAQQPNSLSFNHIKQTFMASIAAGVFIVGVVAVFYFLSNISAAATWTIIITYITCVHSLFIMIGIYGLAKAMSGSKVYFPLFSRLL